MRRAEKLHFEVAVRCQRTKWDRMTPHFVDRQGRRALKMQQNSTTSTDKIKPFCRSRSISRPERQNATPSPATTYGLVSRTREKQNAIILGRQSMMSDRYHAIDIQNDKIRSRRSQAIVQSGAKLIASRKPLARHLQASLSPSAISRGIAEVFRRRQPIQISPSNCRQRKGNLDE
jgi:hypothetical protein